MARAKTVAMRIDEMLATYAELDHEAHELLDLHVAAYVAMNPGVPSGVIKQCEFTNRAGHTLNVPAALRILRDKS